MADGCDLDDWKQSTLLRCCSTRVARVLVTSFMLLSVVSFSCRVSLFANSSDCWIFEPRRATWGFPVTRTERGKLSQFRVIKSLFTKIFVFSYLFLSFIVHWKLKNISNIRKSTSWFRGWKLMIDQTPSQFTYLRGLIKSHLSFHHFLAVLRFLCTACSVRWKFIFFF